MHIYIYIYCIIYGIQHAHDDKKHLSNLRARLQRCCPTPMGEAMGQTLETRGPTGEKNCKIIRDFGS